MAKKRNKGGSNKPTPKPAIPARDVFVPLLQSLNDQTFGVELSDDNIQFDEETPTISWIQAMPLGTYKHPVYGNIDITPERAQRFAASVNEKTRGITLDIDYAHKKDVAKGEKAAGWVRNAEVRDDGVWAQVEWTPTAAQEIRNKEWQYFSPEFLDEWTDHKGVKHRDVLAGGALTNRPFLKDILPVSLTEMLNSSISTDEQETDDEKEEGVEFLKKLAEALGLNDDASEEDVLAHVTKLSESKPEEIKAKKFAEEYPEEAKMLAEQTRKLHEAEVAKKLSELSDVKESKTGLPPSLHESYTALRLGLSGDTAKQFDDFMTDVVKIGPVAFSESGSSRGDNDGEPESFDAVLDAIQASDEGVGKQFGEIIAIAKAKHPALYQKWATSTRIGAGGEK